MHILWQSCQAQWYSQKSGNRAIGGKSWHQVEGTFCFTSTETRLLIRDGDGDGGGGGAGGRKRARE